MAADTNSTTPVTLWGQDGDELLQGGAGDDSLYAYGGNDTLEGLGGNDWLLDSWADATVVRLGPGFGQDTLESYGDHVTTIEFQSGIEASQIQLSLQSVGGSSYAALGVASTLDVLYLKNVKSVMVKFADGSQWSTTELHNRLAELGGTDQNDLISDHLVLPIVRGFQGSDTIIGTQAAKRLQGDEGDDLIQEGGGEGVILLGGADNDRLEVGCDDSTLWGGAGRDTYVIADYANGNVIEAQVGEPLEDSSDLVDLKAFGLTRTHDDGSHFGFARIDIVDGQRDLVISLGRNASPNGILRVRNIDGPQLSALQFSLDSNAPFTLAEMLDWAQTGVLANNIRPAQWLGSDRADVLTGGDSDDTLSGLAGADTLSSYGGNDVLIGGDGNDVLNLYGGRGVLVGGDGGDTYAVATQADIVEAGATNTGLDVLKFSLDFRTMQVKVSGQDLVIQNANDGHQVTVKDFYATDAALRSGIDRYDIDDLSSQVRFSVTPEAMARAASGVGQGSELESDLLLGGSGGDYLQGGSHQATGFQDYISGGAGNDTIRSFSGALIAGGEGDDTIEVLQFRGDTGQIAVSGDAGNDTITVVSDHLSSDAEMPYVSGGAGDDTFVIRSEHANITAGEADKVVLIGTMANGAALTAGDVTARHSYLGGRGGADYELRWGEASGQVPGYVTLYAPTDSDSTPLVVFTDGTSWTRADLNRLATIGTDAADELYGARLSSDTLIGGNGRDRLVGLGGNDTYDGGAGDDDIVLLSVNSGDTTLVRFGPGGGHDTVDMNPNDISRNAPVLLELTGGTVATDWSVDRVEQRFGSTPYDRSSIERTTLTYKPSGESIQFRTFASDTVTLPLTVRFGGGGPTQTFFEFLQASQKPPAPLPLMLQGTNADDSLVGGVLNDTLIGLEGNDTFAGGQGNDVIDVGYGDDVVRYALGDGDDTVVVGVGGHVTLELDGPFLPADLSVQQQVDGVHLSFGALPGSVTFGFEIGSGIPNIEISLGASGGLAGSVSLEELLFLSPGNLNAGMALTGSNGADTLSGSSGRDTLSGGAGADLLIGGSNSDVYQGGAGDDLIIDRPAAADLRPLGTRTALQGGQDTYLFGRGDGVDTVIDTGSPGNSDILQFGAGISLVDIELVRRSVVGALDGHSPSITTALPQLDYESYRIKGTSDEIRFTTDVAEASPGPEWLRFADGTVVQASQLEAGAAAPIGMQATGTSQPEIVRGTTLADTLTGGLGNDTLLGGTGSDLYVYTIGDGADLIQESQSKGYGSDVDTLTLHGALSLSNMKFHREIVAIEYPVQLTTDTGITIEHHTEYRYTDVIDLGAGKDQIQVSWEETPGAYYTDSLDPSRSLGVLELIKLDNGQSLTGAELTQRVVAGGLNIRGHDFGNVLSGALGQDLIDAGSGDDRLSGDAGNDTLLGADGADLLVGGVGNDLLDGGAGADLYKFAVGDGSDTIHADGLDTIALGAGLTKANVQIGKLGAKLSNAVVLSLGGNASDTITLDNAGTWAGLQLKFADGSSLTGAEILAAATKPDNLTLNGTTKADTLTGKDGNDTLTGLAGNDTLAGGKGNDSLIGGKGNDTYLFSRGEGQDVIVDADSTWFNSDLLKVGGATSKQLWLSKSGSNLDIKILGTTDKVTVQNWFAGSANQVEKITASDGKSLSASKVQALVNAMASFTPPTDAASLPANTPAAFTKLVASSWA